MWRSKPNDNVPSNVAGAHDQDESDQPRPSTEDGLRQPTERTRLLPPQPDAYLDPSDPAVSPYNLWSVRFLRYLMVLFAAITTIWFALLLVSIFVSPPGFSTRGSGFTDFAFTCLALGLLIVSLLFFKEPSMAMRISLLVVGVILVIDAILIVSVQRLRLEEGWIGIVSVIWAVWMATYCLLTDRVVDWGKREEEERLTGRVETRRTLLEWLGVLVATVIMFIFTGIVVLMSATLILRSLDAGLAPNGERYAVDGNKYEVHLDCVGKAEWSNGTAIPTVLIESGEVPSESGLEPWAYKLFDSGIIPRYCYWDRPGYAWSDDAPSPLSAGMAANALAEALVKANETGPWISLSAGYGSVVARIFATRNRNQVTGMLMIDPLHEDLLYRVAAPGQGFALWGWGVLSPLGIQRLGGALFKGRSKEDRVFGRSVGQSGKFLKAKLQENLVANSLTKSEAMNAREVQQDDVPLVVISSGIESGKDSEWSKKQDDMARYTDNLLSHDTIPGVPHEVWQVSEGRVAMKRGLQKLLKKAANFEVLEEDEEGKLNR